MQVCFAVKGFCVNRFHIVLSQHPPIHPAFPLDTFCLSFKFLSLCFVTIVNTAKFALVGNSSVPISLVGTKEHPVERKIGSIVERQLSSPINNITISCTSRASLSSSLFHFRISGKSESQMLTGFAMMTYLFILTTIILFATFSLEILPFRCHDFLCFLFT